jgi:hypothetical protein
MITTTIYVKLVDEDVPCWRPVQAVEAESGCFRIVDANRRPDVERWEFNVDQVVRCNRDRRATELVRTPYKTLNREWVVFNLQQAQEEIGRTIREIESHPDYDSGEYLVAMSHAYHHMNTAWNSREAPAAKVERCSEEDFYQWRRFPGDIDLGL